MKILTVLILFLCALFLWEKHLLALTLLIDVHFIRFQIVLENFVSNPNTKWPRRIIGDFFRCIIVTTLKMVIQGDYHFEKLIPKFPAVLGVMAIAYSLHFIGFRKLYHEKAWIRSLVNIEFQLAKTHMYLSTFPMFLSVYTHNPMLIGFLTNIPEGLGVRMVYMVEGLILDRTITFKYFIDKLKLYLLVNIVSVACYHRKYMDNLSEFNVASEQVDKTHMYGVFLLLVTNHMSGLQTAYGEKPIMTYVDDVAKVSENCIKKSLNILSSMKSSETVRSIDKGEAADVHMEVIAETAADAAAAKPVRLVRAA